MTDTTRASALMQFVRFQTQRAMNMNPFALEYYAEAHRLLEGIREMLPREQGVAAYGPSAVELVGKLVVAPTLSRSEDDMRGGSHLNDNAHGLAHAVPDAGEEHAAVAGILRQRDGAYHVFDRYVDPERTTPVTREDIDLLQEQLLQEGSGGAFSEG